MLCPVPFLAYPVLKPELPAFFKIGDVYSVVHMTVCVQVVEPDVEWI
jgi:hypothetical protein